jgi:hypothetical protein
VGDPPTKKGDNSTQLELLRSNLIVACGLCVRWSKFVNDFRHIISQLDRSIINSLMKLLLFLPRELNFAARQASTKKVLRFTLAGSNDDTIKRYQTGHTAM